MNTSAAVAEPSTKYCGSGGKVSRPVNLSATSVVGGFTLAKDVQGDAAGIVPDGTEFLVDWTAALPDDVTYEGDLSGTLTVLADGTVVNGPQDLPVGTVVTFAEQTPLPEVPNVVWGTPTYAPGTELTITENGGAPVAVTVTTMNGAAKTIEPVNGVATIPVTVRPQFVESGVGSATPSPTPTVSQAPAG